MPSSTADNAIMTLGDAADNLKVTERAIYRLAGAKQVQDLRLEEVRDFPRRTLMGGSKINLRWSQSALHNKSNSSLTQIF